MLLLVGVPARIFNASCDLVGRARTILNTFLDGFRWFFIINSYYLKLSLELQGLITQNVRTIYLQNRLIILHYLIRGCILIMLCVVVVLDIYHRL
jgi:hypothetical protein